ncbi:MAG TPA: SDR family NAD(P)-dependent oxidoreductase [Solirubrobacteraceae bacterium]|nr:SDR family NAD(P)-dependent oxidoreductase [Solirubrobacteraceae bacterium]
MSGEPRLSGKRVIVTGAARGLGREFALHLAELGARVLAVDVLEDQLDGTRALAGERGYEVITAIVDVTSSEQTRGLAARADELMGGLDALVNNAAVVGGLARRAFDEIPEDEWDRVLTVNLKGAWLCAKATVPLIRRAGGGSIVNLASEVAFSGSAGLAHYVASKAAVIGLTRNLARELGRDGIRVNALAPGFIPTEASAALVVGGEYDTTRTPLGRVGLPADLLGALALLVSDESAFISGQTLMVNGGRLLH